MIGIIQCLSKIIIPPVHYLVNIIIKMIIENLEAVLLQGSQLYGGTPKKGISNRSDANLRETWERN